MFSVLDRWCMCSSAEVVAPDILLSFYSFVYSCATTIYLLDSLGAQKSLWHSFVIHERWREKKNVQSYQQKGKKETTNSDKYETRKMDNDSVGFYILYKDYKKLDQRWYRSGVHGCELRLFCYTLIE